MKKKLLRILIIEDNIDHADLLSQVIERNFAPVDLHSVETVDDALDFIEQTDYNLVFTDLYINNSSIIAEIPQLRSKLGDVPLIVLTGSGDESAAAEVIKKGGTEYLVKTRDSIEHIAPLISKYSKGSKKHSPLTQKKEASNLEEKILDEVSSINRQAKRVSSTSGSRIPDIKQLESLLDQIQRLKDLASKMMDK